MYDKNIFEYFGFRENGSTGNHLYGKCPFCRKEDKFYVNMETQQWDCKVCSESGNSSSFLQKWWLQQHKKGTKANRLYTLAKLRNLPKRALREFGIIRKPEGGWLIPYFNEKGNLVDLREWKPRKGTRSIPRTTTKLLGINELVRRRSSNFPVYLCEGEWDAIALWWLLKGDIVVVAVPGAGTFKNEWVEYFVGRDVVLCYDNDAAGERGREKAKQKLHGITRSLSWIEWPEEAMAGYDIRDLINGLDWNKSQVEFFLQQRVVSEDVVDSVVSSKLEDHVKTISWERCLRIFRENVLMSEDLENALRIMAAHIFSVQLTGDPLWTYIVGSPGAGKTLLLRSFQASSRCSFHSSLTSASLVSGWIGKGGDPSLLPTWNGKCAVLKDFTEILSKPQQEKEDIFSTLRGAYDGHVRKLFGNGVVREYEVHFSLLAGVTQAIYRENQAMMGERFLQYHLRQKDIRSVIEQSLKNAGKEIGITRNLCEAMTGFLQKKGDPNDVKVPNWVRKKLVDLVLFLSKCRIHVERDRYDGSLVYHPEQEVGTRMANQLLKLGRSIAFVEGKRSVDLDVWNLMVRVGKDTVLSLSAEVVDFIAEQPNYSSDTKTIHGELNIPTTTVLRLLENLLISGLLHRENKTQGVGRPVGNWVLDGEVIELWRQVKR